MKLRSTAAITLAVLVTCVPRASADTKLEDLLARGAAYVDAFVRQFSNVVAEETYLQEQSIPHRKRELKADYMLVKAPGGDGWLLFRDVSEVDGKPIRDQQDRLTRLFLSPFNDALARAREITRAADKYNLVNVGNINNPLIALALLQDNYQPRFHYTMSGLDKKVGPDVRVVHFEEFRVPTVLHGNGADDLPARGLFWIEEPTGRVARTELQVGSRTFPVRITTTFTHDDVLDMDVPAEMREWYPDGAGEITGVATYSHFRRFEVKTEEQVGKK